MALWIEFHKPDLTGNLAPALGSDGFQRCDGRASIRTAKIEAQRRAHNLRFVQPHYSAFRIMSGDMPRNSRAVSGLIAIRKAA